MRFGVNMKPKAEKVRFGPPSSPLVGEVDAVMFYSNFHSGPWSVAFHSA